MNTTTRRRTRNKNRTFFFLVWCGEGQKSKGKNFRGCAVDMSNWTMTNWRVTVFFFFFLSWLLNTSFTTEIGTKLEKQAWLKVTRELQRRRACVVFWIGFDNQNLLEEEEKKHLLRVPTKDPNPETHCATLKKTTLKCLGSLRNADDDACRVILHVLPKYTKKQCVYRTAGSRRKFWWLRSS